jgi:branched-chain amino acid aminotransferase
MNSGAQQLGMPFEVDAMFLASLQVLRANQMKDAYLRPLAVYALGGLGLDVGALSTHRAVFALPWKTHLGEAGTRGVRLRTSPLRRNPRSSIPPLKLCGGYVNSVIAKLESTRAGFDEALFVDDAGFVCEATGENVFLVRNGEVIAVEHGDALPGITRASIRELSDAKARPVTREELLDADEVFLTGTSAEVAPVTQLDERHYPVGPVTRDLQATYASIVRGESPSYARWLTEVAP